MKTANKDKYFIDNIITFIVCYKYIYFLNKILFIYLFLLHFIVIILSCKTNLVI